MHVSRIAVAGAETLRGEEFRQRWDQEHLTLYGSPDFDETVLTSSASGGQVIHPYDEKEILSHAVIVDFTRDPLLSDHLQGSAFLYLYAGEGEPPPSSQPYLPWTQASSGTRFHALHPAVSILLHRLGKEGKDHLDHLTVSCFQGASFRGREAREELFQQTVEMLNQELDSDLPYAFNVRPHPHPFGFQEDLDLSLPDGSCSSLFLFEAPFFHGIVTTCVLEFSTVERATEFTENLNGDRDEDTDIHLYRTIRDETMLFSMPQESGRRVGFSFFADEMIHGLIPDISRFILQSG